MSRLYYHEKSDRRKWAAITIVVLLIIAAIVLGVLSNWYTDFNKYCVFGHDYGEDNKCVRCGKDKPIEELEQANSNVVIQTVMAQGMQLNAAPAAAATPDTYTLTATITPASADDKRVEWTVAWKNAQSVWAIGKTVTEYVTVTPTSANALTATVACVKDFGEQVIVTAKSLDNAEATAQCTVDYVQRITGCTFNMPSLSSTSTSFTYELEYSNYTIAAEVYFGSLNYEIYLTSDFQTTLNNNIQKLPYSASNFVSFDVGNFDMSDGVLTLQSYNSTNNFAPSGIVGCFMFADNDDYNHCNLTEWDIVNCFKQAANSVSGNHFSLDICYSTTYNGKQYSSGSQIVYGRFDGAALYIPVTSLSLSNGSLVF